MPSLTGKRIIVTGGGTGIGQGIAVRLAAEGAKVCFSYVRSDLVHRADGCAEFWVEGRSERVTMTQGPIYNVRVVYAPSDENYVCFEPMAATINAMNPMKDGSRPELQSILSGVTWRESFWIHSSIVQPKIEVSP